MKDFIFNESQLEKKLEIYTQRLKQLTVQLKYKVQQSIVSIYGYNVSQISHF